MSTQLIGDAIYHQGELVALLVVTGASATVLGDFTDRLETGSLRDEEIEAAEAKMEEPTYSEVMTDLAHNLKRYARGGLVKLTDVQNIVNQLKEEKGLE